MACGARLIRRAALRRQGDHDARLWRLRIAVRAVQPVEEWLGWDDRRVDFAGPLWGGEIRRRVIDEAGKREGEAWEGDRQCLFGSIVMQLLGTRDSRQGRNHEADVEVEEGRGQTRRMPGMVIVPIDHAVPIGWKG